MFTFWAYVGEDHTRKGRQFERDEALGVIEELLTRRRQVDLFVVADEEGTPSSISKSRMRLVTVDWAT